MMGSYCHCQQVVTFVFFFFFFFFFGLHLTTWVKGPTLTLCPGPLNFSGWPCVCVCVVCAASMGVCVNCSFYCLYFSFQLVSSNNSNCEKMSLTKVHMKYFTVK